MEYPKSTGAFIPGFDGKINPLNPLTLPPEEADAIFGKPMMDMLRERAKKPFTINCYIQIVPIPNDSVSDKIGSCQSVSDKSS